METKQDETAWEAYKKEIIQLRIEFQRCSIEKFGDEGHQWWEQKFIDFANEVRANIQNYGEYVAWHSLIGSSSSMEFSPHLDLPEPYNIKNYCKSLIEELKNLPE